MSKLTLEGRGRHLRTGPLCQKQILGVPPGSSLSAHDHANALCLPFTEDQPSPRGQVLRALHEPEAHAGPISAAQARTVHGHHAGSLAHDFTVNDRLQGMQIDSGRARVSSRGHTFIVDGRLHGTGFVPKVSCAPQG